MKSSGVIQNLWLFAVEFFLVKVFTAELEAAEPSLLECQIDSDFIFKGRF